MPDETAAITRDLAAVGRLSAVPSILRILCNTTGMGFAAVARVSDYSWTACAIEDRLKFGLALGGQLELATTLCMESRQALQPIIIQDVSASERYRTHHTPQIYGLQSYVSVPIVLANGDYFGNLCAIDPQPAAFDEPRILTMFTAYAELIGKQLDLEEASRRVDVALAQERTQSALLEQYVAVLGHDLRNPLNAIRGCAELLRRRGPGVDANLLAERILGSARRMARLVDDVLDFTRIRLGDGLSVQRSLQAEVEAALRAVVAEVAMHHPRHQLVEHLVIPGTVTCDLPRIQQLLSNLLANAFVHGSAAQPVLVTGRLADTELVLVVQNGGSPIPAEHLEKLFEPYYRSLDSRQGGGLGLGLHICAQIAAAHGGRIEVRSDAGEGTTFTVHLPVT